MPIYSELRRLIQSVLRYQSSELGDEGDAHYFDEIDYCVDMIVDAARELVEAVDHVNRVL